MNALARVPKLITRIRGSFRARHTVAQSDADLREELESHLEMHIAENIRRGMSPDAARRDARLAAGGVTQAAERAREQHVLPWLESLLADLRDAFRGRILVQHPVFSLAVILSLAIGISLSAGVFAIVESAHYGRMPFVNAERVEHVVLTSRSHPDDRDHVVPAAIYSALIHVGGPIERVAAYRSLTVRIRHDDRYGEAWISQTTNGFPSLIGMRPELGRLFDERDDAQPVVILSHDYWQSEFNGDSTVIGSTIEVDGQFRTIVGVVNAATSFPARTPFWESGFRGGPSPLSHVGIVVLLHDVAARNAARARISAVGEAAMHDLASRSTARIMSVSLREYMLEGALAIVLFALGIIASFVALIAAVNFAALMLARGIRRRAELGVRAALGASVRQLVRHIVGECLLLCAIGGALGALFAASIVRPMTALLNGGALPAWLTISIGWRTVSASIAAAIVVGIVFGCGAAIDIARPSLANFLRGASGTASDAGRLGRIRSRLVAIQVGLATTVLVALGSLVGRTILQSEPRVGFDYARVIRAYTLDTINQTKPQPAERIERVLAEARQTPGVAAAGFRRTAYQKPEGVVAETPAGPVTAEDAGVSWVWIYRVSTGFFDVIKPRIVDGRLPSDDELRRGDAVAVLAQSAARTMFDGHAVGKRLRLMGSDGPFVTVIGVIEDVRDHPSDLRSTTSAFIPMNATGVTGLGVGGPKELWVRASGPVAPTLRTLRTHLTPPQLDGVRVEEWMPMSTLIWSEFATYRRITILFGTIFGVSLLLAAIGIYGLVAYTAEMKSRELAIREALGASRLHIAGRVLSVAAVQSLIGVAIGALGATLLIEHLNNYQMKLTPVAGSTAVAMGLVALTVLLASIGPVVRAWTRELTLELRA